ncbi:hypothetical protein DEIGR_100327 [Deinococcus grandis]|uniref:Uncharacterized protein n=1 Tax=Deinococcus grandis TaxID=57498 RepID=A0A100HJ16_9DEIO|nr:hypothetical protein DEGR_29510 [Deinococcus grandis]GAQ20300.1 hypothetical protein DEIGR_100327 [Deinococcus grandis]
MPRAVTPARAYAGRMSEGLNRTPVEWLVKAIPSERMRLVELLRRVGEERAPGAEWAERRPSDLTTQQTESA